MKLEGGSGLPKLNVEEKAELLINLERFRHVISKEMPRFKQLVEESGLATAQLIRSLEVTVMIKLA